MPELPEVEVTRQGISPHLEKKQLTNVVIRTPQLRYAIPSQPLAQLTDQTLERIERRGKYLLLYFNTGIVIIHLGMSGHLRVLPHNTPLKKHDHVDFEFGDCVLRYHDPRRFGLIDWHDFRHGNLTQNKHLKTLGVEPLSRTFSANHFYDNTRKTTQSIKQCLLSGKVVVGIGNIYCSESLFLAGIHPEWPANQLTQTDYKKLVYAIKHTLNQAIAAGGSSLRDFINPNGAQGYFQQTYAVYQRTHKPCRHCGTPIQKITQQQRASFFCPICQPHHRPTN